jgi:hypothetical protein
MKRTLPLILGSLILVAAVLACNISPTLTPAPPPGGGPTEPPVEPPAPAVLRVTYVKGGNVWLWTEGVGTLALTASGDAQQAFISDDGQVVAYIRQIGSSGPELWAVNNDGSNNRQLVSTAELWAIYTGDPGSAPMGIGPYRVDWRPGTHELYYNTQPIYEGPGLSIYNDLRMVDADTLVKTVLFAPGDGGHFYFSPDGAQIAIVAPDHIDLVNADGSNLRPNVLVYDWVITYSEYQYYPRPVWAPDSSGLRVVVPPQDPLADPLPASNVWYIPADGSPESLSTSILAMPFAWPDSAISPDLNRLAYAVPVGIPTDNLRDLHISGADGSGDAVYINAESLEFVGWAPDSLHFIFEVHGPGPLSGTHLGVVGGGTITLASDSSLMTDFAWTDAAHYLYLYRNAGTWELRYDTLGGGSLLLDTGDFWDFDFSY